MTHYKNDIITMTYNDFLAEFQRLINEHKRSMNGFRMIPYGS